MTYDLRCLRRNGFLTRTAGSQRYQLTAEGRTLAVFAKTSIRVIAPALAELEPVLPDTIAERTPLARAWRAYERALDNRVTDAALAARRETQP